MTPHNSNLHHLAIARDILLTPFGLDETKLASALASMFSHKIDYADLYFQFTKNEGWSLEEGIVKTGHFSIDQGVGVRAISGDKTAFSYTDINNLILNIGSNLIYILIKIISHKVGI